MAFCYHRLKMVMAHYLQHGELVHGGYGSRRCPVSLRQDLCRESRAWPQWARGMQLFLALALHRAERYS